MGACASTRLAACHVSPVFLRAQDTTEKAISFIKEAAKNNAKLVVFPESFIPAFPIWSALKAPTEKENHFFFHNMVSESVYIDGEEINAIRAIAKKLNVIVSIGVSEKVRYSNATLFNSNILIGDDGEILVHHRKLMPTFYEKLTWAPGDGHGLQVVETRVGKIGVLICGENTNPLARYSLAAQGEQIHISTWPAIWPTRLTKVQDKSPVKEPPDRSNFLDNIFGSNYDNVAANRTRAAAHCFEAKCFGIMCAGHLSADVMEWLAELITPEINSETVKLWPRGATMFLDTTGALLPGFTINRETSAKKKCDFLQEEEGILYAEIDLSGCVEGKQYHDIAGGYQRFDVFELKVDRRRREPASFTDE